MKNDFTKELKPSSASPARVSLTKLMRATSPATERVGEPTLNAAATLIKALHRNGGEALRKASK